MRAVLQREENYRQARADMAERARFSDQINLAAVHSAVTCSRLFTAYTLDLWDASAVVDDALLVVSELVAGAVRATGVVDVRPRWSEIEQLNIINVRLLGMEVCIVIEVWDVDPQEPVLPRDELDDAGGRHLQLIDAVASRWGSYPAPRGKVVWAELPICALAASSLPSRPKQSPPPRLPADEIKRPPSFPDLALLRRVRDGLKGL